MGNDKLTPSEISLFSMLCCQAFLWPSSFLGGVTFAGYIFIYLLWLQAVFVICKAKGQQALQKGKREENDDELLEQFT